MSTSPLIWRIPGYYFVYFAALGVFLPFWPLYLKAEGFDAAAIGFLMGLYSLTKLAGPPVAGWLSDHLGFPMRWVRLASLLTLLGFIAVFAAHGLWAITLVMILFTLAWNAAMPPFEAVTLHHLGDQAQRYSRIRLWGSVGFIVTAMGVGPILDAWGVTGIPLILALGFGGMLIFAMLVPNPPGLCCTVDGPKVSAVTILRQPVVWMFLLASLLLQASHGTYYGFYTLHMEQHGHSKALTGGLWALGVLAEVGIFTILHRLLPRFGALRLMLYTLLLTAVRWVMIGTMADSIPALVVAQLLHAFSFGVAHAAGIDFIRQHFVGRAQGRGQALLSSLCYGAGGMLGFWFAGASWQWLGAAPSFALSAVMVLAGAAVIGAALRHQGRPSAQWV